jgi:putative PIG3 family NAD(P)H quinone oxidoreductase
VSGARYPTNRHNGVVYAVTIKEPGGPEVLDWTQVPEPEVGPLDVLVEVAAAGVNRADLLQRAGHYPPPPGAPPYLGLECSGRVIAVGADVAGWATGDDVCALLAGGGYAQRVAVPAAHCLPVPAGVELVDAAALPEVACTVWSNVFDVGGLRPLDTILIHGGGGGIGTFAIQAASAHGARVITTARAAKHAALSELGAEVVVDYTTEDFTAAVRTATGGRGADVVLDIMGASYLERNIEVLAPGGRLIVIGLQGGRVGQLDLGALLTKRASVIGTNLRRRGTDDKAGIVAAVREHLWPMIERRVIRPVVHSRLSMPEASEAHRLIASSDHLGKVLLLP